MSIAQIGTKFINEIADYFSAGQGMQQFGAMERDITKMVQHCACAMVACYLEEVDAHLLADKAARRAAGYSVERRHDVRHVLTTFGELSYTRTYYAHKDGGYAYLADQAVGLEGYSRVSDGVSVALAEAACRMSYAGSSRYVTEGAVSRQTVLHKVRACDAARAPTHPMTTPGVKACHSGTRHIHIPIAKRMPPMVPITIAVKLLFFIFNLSFGLMRLLYRSVVYVLFEDYLRTMNRDISDKKTTAGPFGLRQFFLNSTVE